MPGKTFFIIFYGNGEYNNYIITVMRITAKFKRISVENYFRVVDCALFAFPHFRAAEVLAPDFQLFSSPAE